MKLGILGAGGWGKNLVRVFCQILGESSVTVVDPEPARLDAMQAKHPGIAVGVTPLWEEWGAVAIAAPASIHFELARDALTAGVHTLVEKPLTLNSYQVGDLIELAQRQRLTLMVDHLLEYHPAVVRLKEMKDAGTFGSIQHMTSQRLNLGVIRSEENAWWSLAPHDVSIVLHLMGELPVAVNATQGTYLQEGISDVAHATLRFADGAIVHIHVSWLDPVKTRRFSVVGSLAMAVYDDMAKNKLAVRPTDIVRQDGRFVVSPGECESVLLPEIEPLAAMAEEFLGSIEHGTPPRSDGWDGLRVVRVLEAVQQSMDLLGETVHLEVDDD